jgi:uncharacterized lipoprotein YajG
MREREAIGRTAGFLFVMIFAHLAGCAYPDVQVTLTYPSEQGAVDVPPSAMLTDINGSDIALEVFDARFEKDRIGVHRTNVGIEGSSYVTDDNVATWVQNAIVYHLKGAGFTVHQINGKSAEDAATRLTVDIQRVFGVVKFSYNAHVLLQVTSDKKNQNQITKQYEGSAKTGVAMTGAGSAVGRSLSRALEDAILKMLADDALMRVP